MRMSTVQIECFKVLLKHLGRVSRCNWQDFSLLEVCLPPVTPITEGFCVPGTMPGANGDRKAMGVNKSVEGEEHHWSVLSTEGKGWK